MFSIKILEREIEIDLETFKPVSKYTLELTCDIERMKDQETIDPQEVKALLGNALFDALTS
jgi:hypothetical protein